MIGSLVLSLLFQSCPAAIAGFIVPIEIGESVDAASLGTFAHVSEEVFKGLPAFAHLDSAPAIVAVLSKLPVGAPLNHHVPASVGAADLAYVGMPVSCQPGNYFLPLQATTGKRNRSGVSVQSAADGVAWKDSLVSAFASTEPSRRAAGRILDSFDDRPTPKCFAGEIFEHGLILAEKS